MKFFVKFFAVLITVSDFTIEFSTDFVHFIGEFLLFCEIFLRNSHVKIIEKINSEIDNNKTEITTTTFASPTTTKQPTTVTKSLPLLNFNVTVKTSRVTWSGTDAMVFLYLEIGNDTNKYLLKDQPEKDILEHDQVDNFNFQEWTILT